MRIILLLAVLLQLSMVSFAENEPKLDGEEAPKKKVKDTMLFGDVTSEGEHIPFATIMVQGTTIGTAADNTGHFQLVGLPEGDIEVLVSAVGYLTKKYPLSIKEGKPETLLAKLEADNIGLEQVVVSADRSQKSRKDVSTIVSTISPKLFDRVQGATLSEGLNFTPGLRMENNCQNCGFTQIRMNGLEGPYSQILINSRPVFSGLAGVYGLELIPANMIDRVEVVRGGGSALFGSNAIAGTINLITKEPVQDTYQIESSLGFIGDDGEIDHIINVNGSVVSDDYKTGISFYGFRRDRNAYDANGDGFSEVSEIENSTFGTSFFQRMGERSKLKLDYFYINESRRGGNDFDKPFHEADIAEALDHKINSVNVNFDKLMRVNDKLSFFAAMQHVDRDSYYGANQDPEAYGNSKDLSFAFGGQYHTDLGQFLFAPSELVVGLETSYNSLDDKKLGYLDVETGLFTNGMTITDQTVHTTGIFAQNEWITEKFRFSIGLRAEHYSIEDKVDGHDISGEVISPRGSVLFKASDNLQFRTSFARGYRAPQVFDEDLHIETSGARRVTHENDPDLKQENSSSITLSLDWSKKMGSWQTQFLAEAFYTDLENPFANEYGEPDEDRNVVYTRVNAEDGAVVQGVNFEFNASPGSGFTMQSGLTIQQSKYDSPQTNFEEKKFFRTPECYGYLTMNYSPNTRFDVSLTGNYTGEMLVPYFGPTIADPDAGELRESDPFFDMGIKVGQKITLTKEVSLQLYGGVKNIFNSYQDDFDLGDQRDPAYVYGPLSPRTFYFGVKIGNIF